VYALSAYILAMAKIVPENAVLDQKTLAAVKMPNRDGFVPDPRPEKFPPAKSAAAPKAKDSKAPR
jgi:cytochrome c